jgi:hypothetical protein
LPKAVPKKNKRAQKEHYHIIKTSKMKNILVSMLLVTALASCKKDPAPPPTPVANSSFELLEQKIIVKSCALSGCHASTADNSFIQHGLVLKGADLYKRLLNGSVKQPQALAAGLKQIVPNDPTKSFMYQKVDHSNATYKFGLSMPIGLDDLTPNQILFIKQWINAGAPKDGDVADKNLLN